MPEQPPFEVPNEPFQRAAATIVDGFASPHHLTALPGRISGCIFDASGAKVELSERYGGFTGDHVQSENPERLERPGNGRRLSGRGVYLGHYMAGHYGHFITETLSTFWIFEDQPAAGFDFFLFHPFAFGTGRPEFARACLERFGIPQEKVVIVGDEPLLFDELVVPERLFRLNHSADPRLRWVYGRIAQASEPPPIPTPRIYLSRRRFSRRSFDRVIANEAAIEALFREHGFEIVYPEALGFDQQVALYSRAEIMAGQSGSGLHNSLFMKPDALLIELGDPRYLGLPAPTQTLCDGVSGVQSVFVPFQGRRFGERWTLVFDLPYLRAEMARVLGPPRSARRRGPVEIVSHLTEAAYLLARPILGAWARRVLPRRR